MKISGEMIDICNIVIRAIREHGENAESIIKMHLTNKNYKAAEIHRALYYVLDECGEAIEIGKSPEILYLEIQKEIQAMREAEEVSIRMKAAAELHNKIQSNPSMNGDAFSIDKYEKYPDELIEIIEQSRPKIVSQSKKFSIPYYLEAGKYSGKSYTPRMFPRQYVMKASAITYIGARPGEGKTTTMINLAIDALVQNRHVLFFTYEEPAENIFDKMLLCYWNYSNQTFGKPMSSWFNSTRYREPLDMIQGERSYGVFPFAGIKDEFEWLKEKIEKGSLQVYDNPGTIETLCRMIPGYDKEAIIFIDYIQKVKANGTFFSRQHMMAHISDCLLQNGAIKKRVPIIAGAQVTRFKRERFYPIVDDLREAGDLEQDANKVILMCRDIEDDKIIRSCVAKAREGKVNPFYGKGKAEILGGDKLFFDGEYNYMGVLNE